MKRHKYSWTNNELFAHKKNAGENAKLRDRMIRLEKKFGIVKDEIRQESVQVRTCLKNVRKSTGHSIEALPPTPFQTRRYREDTFLTVDTLMLPFTEGGPPVERSTTNLADYYYSNNDNDNADGRLTADFALEGGGIDGVCGNHDNGEEPATRSPGMYHCVPSNDQTTTMPRRLRASVAANERENDDDVPSANIGHRYNYPLIDGEGDNNNPYEESNCTFVELSSSSKFKSSKLLGPPNSNNDNNYMPGLQRGVSLINARQGPNFKSDRTVHHYHRMPLPYNNYNNNNGRRNAEETTIVDVAEYDESFSPSPSSMKTTPIIIDSSRTNTTMASADNDEEEDAGMTQRSRTPRYNNNNNYNAIHYSGKYHNHNNGEDNNSIMRVNTNLETSNNNNKLSVTNNNTTNNNSNTTTINNSNAFPPTPTMTTNNKASASKGRRNHYQYHQTPAYNNNEERGSGRVKEKESSSRQQVTTTQHEATPPPPPSLMRNTRTRCRTCLERYRQNRLYEGQRKLEQEQLREQQEKQDGLLISAQPRDNGKSFLVNTDDLKSLFAESEVLDFEENGNEKGRGRGRGKGKGTANYCSHGGDVRPFTTTTGQRRGYSKARLQQLSEPRQGRRKRMLFSKHIIKKEVDSLIERHAQPQITEREKERLRIVESKIRMFLAVTLASGDAPSSMVHLPQREDVMRVDITHL